MAASLDAALAAVKSLPSGVFINNAFHPSLSGSTLSIADPSTGEQIATVADGSAADVDAAVIAARDAFSGSAWSAYDGSARGKLLATLADAIEKNADVIAAIESLDSGKPYHVARHHDVNAGIRMLRHHAALAEVNAAQSGRVLSPPGWAVPQNSLAFTTRSPIGAVAGVFGFNFPLCGALAKLAPAIAAGCTIVLKPSHQNPLSCVYLALLITEAGFPPGVVNIVTGGRATGHALVSHPLIKKVSFTGSCAVGKAIAEVCSARCARVTLELGGKNAMIVAPDADVEAAAKLAVGANFYNSGQICVAMSRVFVPDSMTAAFVQAAVSRAGTRVLGSPWDPKVDLGPLVDNTALSRVLAYVATGVSSGARVACGGKRWEGSGSGYFMEPTILVDVQDANVCAREEIFGPVMSVLSYSGDLDAAIARANEGTPFGLAATVVTRDVATALRSCAKLHAGTVWINAHGEGGQFTAQYLTPNFGESSAPNEKALLLLLLPTLSQFACNVLFYVLVCRCV